MYFCAHLWRVCSGYLCKRLKQLTIWSAISTQPSGRDQVHAYNRVAPWAIGQADRTALRTTQPCEDAGQEASRNHQKHHPHAGYSLYVRFVLHNSAVQRQTQRAAPFMMALKTCVHKTLYPSSHRPSQRMLKSELGLSAGADIAWANEHLAARQSLRHTGAETSYGHGDFGSTSPCSIPQNQSLTTD